MWDKPEYLKRIADALFVLALLGVLYAVLIYALHQPIFNIRLVRIVTPIDHVTQSQIEEIIRREVRGSLFTLNLIAVRSGFEKLPWVRRADIRRQWPGGLEVALIEHVPLARWGKEALVNVEGEIFNAAFDKDLPIFNGPSGTAKEMTIQFVHMQNSLAEIKKIPKEVSLSVRRAWQVRLQDGMTLDLGRDQLEERLRRFVVTYPQTIAKMNRRVDRVDLRYANGFAVRVPSLPVLDDPKEKRGT